MSALGVMEVWDTAAQCTDDVQWTDGTPSQKTCISYYSSACKPVGAKRHGSHSQIKIAKNCLP